MIKLIHFTHWAVLTFVLTAWALPFQAVLWVHVFFIPLMVIHWRTNRNRCFLSQLEERYKAAEANGATASASGIGSHVPPEVDAEESQFIKLVITKVFGRVPADDALEKINYAIVCLVWALSVTRLTLMAKTA